MTDYNSYINKTSSVKEVFAHIEPAQKLVVWNYEGAGVYSKAVNYFVIEVTENGNQLTPTDNTSPAQGEFYYDINNGILYVHTSDSDTPDNKDIIGFYRFFFASCPEIAPYDLDNGEAVSYEGRISSVDLDFIEALMFCINGQDDDYIDFVKFQIFKTQQQKDY